MCFSQNQVNESGFNYVDLKRDLVKTMILRPELHSDGCKKYIKLRAVHSTDQLDCTSSRKGILTLVISG